MDVNKIVKLLKDNHRFMTLSEIYDAFKKEYSKEINDYKDYRDAVRTTIYRNSLYREANKKNNDIFVPLRKEKSFNQKYGLAEWRRESYNHLLTEDDVLDIKSDIDIENYLFDSEKYKKKTITSHERSVILKANYLEKIMYKCEYDNHRTFARKSNGENYTEVHHLIPLSAQKHFKINLDCEENLVSLCPLCHTCLHYGDNPTEILKKLYDMKIEGLNKIGIFISFEELLKYYL